MFYIKQTETEFIKYEIVLDKKQLEKIKYEVIAKCGEIISHHYQGNTCKHDCYDTLHIKFYNEEFVKVIDYNDFYSSNENIYEYRYIEYKDTHLVKLIDALLKGDCTVIDELKNPVQKDIESSIKNPEEEIRKVLNHSPLNEEDAKHLKQLLKDLERYLEYKKLNQSRKSDLEYYEQVLKCIIFIEIDCLPITEYQKLKDINLEINKLMDKRKGIEDQFFSIFKNTNKEEILKKELKKEPNK